MLDEENSDGEDDIGRDARRGVENWTRAIDWDEIRGYLYVWWWDKRFSLRRALGRWSRNVLLLSISIELFGLISHEYPVLETVSPKVKLPVLGAMWLSVLVLMYHHYRLEIKIKRYEAFMTGIRLTSAEASTEKTTEETCDKFLSDTLTNLKTHLEFQNRKRSKISAAILLQTSQHQAFTIRCQKPDGRYSHDLRIDGQQSAAAKVHEVTDSPLFIPWTRGRHGVRILAPQGGEKYRRTKLEPKAMQVIESTVGRDRLPVADVNARRSLLCVRIPIETHLHNVESKPRATLCVETNRRAGLGELEFQITQVFASLIARVMCDLVLNASERQRAKGKGV